MEKPRIAGYRSKKMDMEPGVYFYCTCGKSINQPFCDGEHKDSCFKPAKVTIEESKMVPWCLCKYSDKGHICDGKHRELKP
ncbi:MAG: CDGSH iron-sulfur domain-containing protein [Chlorobi bacterium]|nr:CDGSH iron-sulfur domain-containing protein [Chlorobiota bacterium]